MARISSEIHPIAVYRSYLSGHASMLLCLPLDLMQLCIGISSSSIFIGLLFFALPGFGAAAAAESRFRQLPYTGGDRILPNCQTSLNSFKKGARDGNAQSQLSLGICQWHGKGVSRNVSAAANNFRLAAEQGNSSAQLNYAYCLLWGEGIAANATEAAQIFKRLADHGDSEAQPTDVHSLRDVLGVPANKTQAL